MLFRSATSVAVLACAASAAAKPQPYKLAVMAVPGMSLSRRDTAGYQPEESNCGDGNTCAEACGTGYAHCPSEDSLMHCFNPEVNQSCCTDGTGSTSFIYIYIFFTSATLTCNAIILLTHERARLLRRRLLLHPRHQARDLVLPRLHGS